ncbi:putative mpv17 pmp22 family protein [Rosellinia necatrix]|uniref:Putative mpv17 pmp22 family protein n=1 Tax=Rosellinia necatrix TaxID=77044 RepID=A0A1W2TAW0_ROSNE|nr:putative mpv17 pmp22 family protein [Rosellinia necatrix]
MPSAPYARQQGSNQARPGAKADPIPLPNIVAPLPFWQRLGPLTRAGQAYARAQRARPWATQVASTLFIYLCADFGAQQMSPSKPRNKVDGNPNAGANGAGDDNGATEEVARHDWARTARSLAIGGTAAIPGYIWFTFLSRSFNYSSRVLSIGVKVAVNQLTFTPLFNVYFFGSQALLSGDTPAEAWRRVCNTVPVSFVNSCKLWPAVTAFSFAFIPFEYRSIFGGVIAVGWQTYLSFLNGRAESLEALHQQNDHHAAAAPDSVRPPLPQQQQQQQAVPLAATLRTLQDAGQLAALG